MAKLDPQVLAHLEWLGFVRPTGLVVSAPALVRAGAILNQRDAEGQRLLRACADGDTEADALIADFPAFAGSVLGWRFSPKGYAGTPESPIPPELEVPLPDAGETLRPDFAVRELEPQDGATPWQLLVRVLGAGESFDAEIRGRGRLELSPHSRMERLLRLTGVPAGLLVNGKALRLVSAPRGESSGWLDFRVADMVQTAGRPIVSSLRLLLSEQRLLTLPRQQRLAALLADSRKFQNEVSEKLSEQVLHALYELLRGFQSAHDATKGELLRKVVAEHPDQIYRALLTVILRLVFLLYAEERDMLPQDETFLRYYSLAGLYERLREDAALYPDTMDQRFGAWAQLVALFRMVHDGAAAPQMHLPPRHGVLFDPDRFPFLEGRTPGEARQIHARITPPLVPDGTVYRALEKLLVLDGERISYRALDVEQIGSVYETMMGFRLETAIGQSVAIKSQKKQGAPTAIDLEALLAAPGATRAKSIEERADRKLTDVVSKAVVAAVTLEDLHAALQPVIDLAATPDLVPQGAMVLQPSEERRRSQSHYTPRELTQPIVRTTLDPILAKLRGTDDKPPRPEAILDLKICDPAMGSGAFLVEACRYLGDALVDSWHASADMPAIPQDEDEVVFARRLVAQRCLYGVDRNPVAVDLAKMSLWLVTLAKDHALTFVDHALRHGDSLVGLSRRQLEAFHWEADAPSFQAGFEAMRAREHLAKFTELRRRICEADEGVTDRELRDLWDEAQFELRKVRLLGDLAVAAYFEADKPKEREAKRLEFVNAVLSDEAERMRGWLEGRRHAEPPLAPFHWEIEFPEVFERDNPGFDAFIGNPPFLRGRAISGIFSPSYLSFLLVAFSPAGGQSDLVAYFFRRAFSLLRSSGVLGLIGTKTISQGDTRVAGLGFICLNGGTILSAIRRLKWSGQASVTVSLVHIVKSPVSPTQPVLDGKPVEHISSFLLKNGPDEGLRILASNSGLAFKGVETGGMAFVFSDRNRDAMPLSLMKELLQSNPLLSEIIRPFIGGDEILVDPLHRHERFVVDFGERNFDEARNYHEPFTLVGKRLAKTTDRDSGDKWWWFRRRRPELRGAIANLQRVLVRPYVAQYPSFVFLDARIVVSAPHTIFASDSYAMFCVVQSQVHEVFSSSLGLSLEDRPVYTPSDCFETFPLPLAWEVQAPLLEAGARYYTHRATLMSANQEGLTKTYARFHDSEERDPGIVKLRELGSLMDRAVLDAYGWKGVPSNCAFFTDYEVEEEKWLGRDRRKLYRYRWPDDVRDEVLARLLELNAERARAEARAGATARGKKMGKAVRSSKPDSDVGDLLS
jgi:hypothetical protein